MTLFQNDSSAPQWPFAVGDTIHEVRAIAYLSDSLDQAMTKIAEVEVDLTRPDAIVTALTDKGFTYEYTHPTPHGRAQWGEMLTGGECYVDGYPWWRLVTKAPTPQV